MTIVRIASMLILIAFAATNQTAQEVNKRASDAIKELENQDRQAVPSKFSDLGRQLLSNYVGKHGLRLAIGDFPTIDGKLTNMSLYIAEELNTQLTKSRKFQVIEQEMVKAAFKEMKRDPSVPIDQSSLFDLGSKLYAEAFVFGTITDLGKSVEINVRIVATELGSTLSSGSIEIAADQMTDRLLGKEKKVVEQAPPPKPDTVVVYREKVVEKAVPVPVYVEKPKEETPQPQPAPVPEVFFKEDFSSYEIGDRLNEWGNNVVVLQGKDRRKYISSQMQGKHAVSRKVEFPDNFSFQFEFLQGGFDIDFVLVDGKGDEFKVRLRQNFGNRVQLPGTVEKKTGEKELNTFKLVKSSFTYKAYINGDFMVSGEYRDYSKFVEFRMEIPEGRYFTEFVGRRAKN